MGCAPALMVQGTGSDVGKSLLVAGLCRLYKRRGLAVRPFKPQNMSNNAAVTAEGGEIGRAQALQARAAGIEPSVHMNPILLKPEGETGSQLVVQGRRAGSVRGTDYWRKRAELMPTVLDSFERVSAEADLVLVEGAGSASEVNLRAGDIANMGFAEAADIPVVLIGDIERGGVIASLVGTHALLGPAERARVKGFIINKFRGDATLFAEGVRIIADRTGWPSLGLVPWFPDAARLPAEDSVDLPLRANGGQGSIVIVVPVLPRIANFDDLDPLRLESSVSLVLLERGKPIPAGADLVILPGSKATIADLAALREEGWDIDLRAHLRRSGAVLGLCGGYQMLGRTISDPQGIEGPPGAVKGLGLLAVDTVLTSGKLLSLVSGRELSSGMPVTGYEMHLGTTDGPDRERAFLEINGHSEGAVSPDGLVSGTYLHGLFTSDAFRSVFLARLQRDARSELAYEAAVEAALDGLALHLERALNIDALLAIARVHQSAAKRPMSTA
jgi:adenosylcobyric acid synthase